MKKVFASDFDGTLYFYKAEVKLPPESVKKMRRSICLFLDSVWRSTESPRSPMRWLPSGGCLISLQKPGSVCLLP